MENISSKQNDKIKFLKKLALTKHRYQEGKFVVENLTVIVDALRAGYDFVELFVTQEFIDKRRAEFEYLRNNSRGRFYLINEAVNQAFSELITAPGIAGVYEVRTQALDFSRPVVYLDNINDPGNLGTILRTALAFNFLNIVLNKDCVDIYNSKVIQAAREAIFKLNILSDESGDWLEKNKKSWEIYSTSSHQGTALRDFVPPANLCLVIGNEVHGVTEKNSNLAQGQLRIEMGEKMESLNVAVATAIFLYILQTKL